MGKYKFIQSDQDFNLMEILKLPFLKLFIEDIHDFQ